MKRDGIFQIVAEELFRKGTILETENKILVKLARFLRLETDEARAIVKIARISLSDASGSAAEGDTALRVYTRVSAALRTPTGPHPAAEPVLSALRVLFQMPELKRTGRTVVPPELRETGQVPVLSASVVAVENLPEKGPLEEAAKLARLEQYDEATRAAERVFAVRPPPAGFADGYRKLLPSLLEEAAGEPTPGRVLPLVKWAARLAALPPAEPYRWTVLAELVDAAGPVLAKSGRWDEHAALVAELDRVVDSAQGSFATTLARIASAAIERCLAADRYDESREWHKIFVKQQPFLTQEDVRGRYAAALVRQMEYVAGHRDDGREHFTQMMTALTNLLKAYPADKGVARGFAMVSPAIGVMYLKGSEASAMREFLSSINATIRQFPGDEEIALTFARGLVNTGILAKEIARQAESQKSAFRRFLDGFKKQIDPVVADITITMSLAVASVPNSNAMSDARKRFEGLSGARLLVTQKLERPKSIQRPTIKASRLSRA